jgi:hypothetical protein
MWNRRRAGAILKPGHLVPPSGAPMSSGPAPTPHLVVVNGRMRGAGFDIPPGRSEIGRQAGVAILLDDQDVSRRHAVLDRSGGRVVLADLGSTTAPGSTSGGCTPTTGATGWSCATGTRCGSGR